LLRRSAFALTTSCVPLEVVLEHFGALESLLVELVVSFLCVLESPLHAAVLEPP
jgi:hypothetical protein